MTFHGVKIEGRPYIFSRDLQKPVEKELSKGGDEMVSDDAYFVRLFLPDRDPNLTVVFFILRSIRILGRIAVHFNIVACRNLIVFTVWEPFRKKSFCLHPVRTGALHLCRRKPPRYVRG